MFNTITKLSIIGALVLPGMAFAQTSLEERVAELEASQSLNTFNFSGYLNTRYDDVKASQKTPASTAFDTHTQHMRLRAGLNVNAAVSKKISFYSTLTASKYFNSWLTQTAGSGTAPVTLEDPTVARGERGSQLYLEKAYADYRFADSFAFSFGRLPTFDGPPSHMPLGKARMGTYPSMGYNAPFDGFALSYNTAFSEQTFSARVLYTPMTYMTTNVGKLGGQGSLGDVTINGSKINSISDFYSVMLEYGLGQTVVANKFSLLFMNYQTGELPIDGSLINAGGGAGSGLLNAKVGGNVLVADLTQVMDSDLDLSITYFQSSFENSGSITVPGLGTIFGYGASTQNETMTGASTLVSARYKLSDLFLGVEYLDGGKNVFNYDPSTEVVNGFYSTPGTGTHLYGLYRLTPELGVRLGYMKQEYKSTPFTFGASSDTDREITTYYTDLRLDF